LSQKNRLYWEYHHYLRELSVQYGQDYVSSIKI
jgi:hypothetical protein